MSDYVDRLGNPITVGAFIVYAASGGRAAIMKVGRVMELSQRKEKSYYTDKHEPTVKAITADKWSHQAEWAVQGTGGWWRSDDLVRDKTKGKLITLGDFDKICVIHESMVTGQLREVLDAAFAMVAPAP